MEFSLKVTNVAFPPKILENNSGGKSGKIRCFPENPENSGVSGKIQEVPEFSAKIQKIVELSGINPARPQLGGFSFTRREA